jgi:S1-C subfamily serine protease
MKSQRSRRILLVVVALFGAIVLVVATAVATVFAYRQWSGDERARTSVNIGGLHLGDDEKQAQSQQVDEQGVVIIRVDAGSPAEKAGLTTGTVILGVNGQDVSSPQELKDAIAGYKVGDTITLTIQDGDATKDISVELGDFGPYLGVSVGAAGGNYRVQPAPFGDMPHDFAMPPDGSYGSDGSGHAMPFRFPFGDFGPEGLDGSQLLDLLGRSAVVMSVADDTPAADAGLKAGDAIVEANGQAIKDNQALKDLIGTLSPGDELALQVERGSDTITITVTLASNPDNEGSAYLGVYLFPAQVHRQLRTFPDQQSS